MVRFVVWGAGIRGKTAAKIFGTNRIVAFIDSNSQKTGSNFCGRPVINFGEYKKKYSVYAVLVSLAGEKAVTDILKKENIFFFSYNECPPELIGYGWNRAKKYKNRLMIPQGKIAVYGHTLYSILVYEYLVNEGYECIGLIHNSHLNKKEMDAFSKMFPSINVKFLSEIDQDTVILQTISDFDCEKQLYEKKVKNIFDWKDHIPEYYNPKIAELHNRYINNRCFIVATGPSLTFNDLEKLDLYHEFCISVNTIFCCFDKTKWRPDQYVAVDIDILKHYGSTIKKMDVKEKFIPDASIDFDYDSLTDEFYVYHSIFTKNTIKEGLVSDDCSKYVFNSGTVTAICLQLAVYEGFKEIYLLGCDCSYFKTGLKHFNEPEKMQIKGYGVMDATMEMLNYHINAYKKLKEFAETKGIKIFNATRGGYLEIFERVKFDELF